MNLKEKLENHYKAFNFAQIEPDPLQFPHLYKDEKDIKAMAFISSVFAYGTVAQIVNTLLKLRKIVKTACHARESGHPLCKNKRKNGFPLSWE